MTVMYKNKCWFVKRGLKSYIYSVSIPYISSAYRSTYLFKNCGRVTSSLSLNKKAGRDSACINSLDRHNPNKSHKIGDYHDYSFISFKNRVKG